MSKPLVNLHTHDFGSLLDGCASPKTYVKRAKECGHPAVCITNHGSMQTVFSLYNEAKSQGLKAIMGCEFYITTDLSIKIPNRQRDLKDRDKHVVVLAKNEQGYKNLCKLNYLSFVEGFYSKPRITYDMLFENKEGLIVTTACAAGQVNELFSAGRYEEAEEWFKTLVEQFGENFYGEIQLNEITAKCNEASAQGVDIDQKDINNNIIELAKKYKVKLVLGNDSHYADKEDVKLQDILLNCMGKKDGPETVIQQSFFNARHLYYPTSEDFYFFNKEFGYDYDEELLDECFQNSLDIADKCNYDFKIGANNYPKYNLPEGTDHIEFCTQIAYEGLQSKLQRRIEAGEIFSDEKIEEYEKRLEYEVKVIGDKGYIDYFLVYWDLVKWAKEQGIYCGPGRGSAAGALIAYALDITTIDPIQFGLYFERFMNPDRNASPDIDFDVMQGAREHVRQYLEETYGKESVFGVCTWTIYQPKSAIQDCCRGMGKDTSFESVLMKEITKLPELEKTKDLIEFFKTVKESHNTTPTVLAWIRDNEEVIYWANKMLGLCKTIGTHAGGIVITPGPIYDYIPVVRAGKEVVTAFRESDTSVKELSDLGILKLDILGLKTLNLLKECIENIKTDLGIDISDKVHNLDLEDKKLYKKVRQGNNIGIFQLEGNVQDSLMKSIKPNCFEDVVAINAINRPGPLESFSKVFAEWKNIDESGDKRKIAEIDEQRYPFEFMRGPLSRTYGCLLYQEQFMLMVAAAADFNMGEADSFRRAIAWNKDHPKYYTVKKYFDKLHDGMIEKGYSESDVEKFLEYCRNFMGYSFNLSHCVGYTYLALQNVYLKTYYPVYFYAALLNISDQEEYQAIIADAIANGIDVLPPSINKSQHHFTVEGNCIRIGFMAMKGFGEKAMEEVKSLDLRQYSDIYDILQLPFKKVNKTAFQNLIDAGSFDEFGVERERVGIARELFVDEKIEKWFTRASKALDVSTMPESLYQFPEGVLFSIIEKLKPEMDEIVRVNEENKIIKKQAKKDGVEPVLVEITVKPWRKLVIELLPYIKIKPLSEEQKDKKFEEMIGFSMNMVRKLSQLITLGDKYPDLKLKSISAREYDNDLCYFFVIGVEKKLTKTGKPYKMLKISDGHSTHRSYMWKDLPIEKGKSYVAHFTKSEFGLALTADDYVSEVEL